VPGGSPNATASFRYDGEGERVAQQASSSGVTTTTRYLLDGLEELTTVGVCVPSEAWVYLAMGRLALWQHARL
jgi:hypothetical protein